MKNKEGFKIFITYVLYGVGSFTTWTSGLAAVNLVVEPLRILDGAALDELVAED